MNPPDESHRAQVQRLLESQRPPAASEPLPPLPDDLHRQWSAHFGAQSQAVNSRRWAWVSGLAAAAAIVAGLVWFHRGQSEPSPAVPAGLSAESFPASPAASWETGETQPLSAVSLALLRYQDPATVGLYVHQ